MEEFEKLVEELMTRYPELISAKWFRDLEVAVRQEITRRDDILDSAGVA